MANVVFVPDYESQAHGRAAESFTRGFEGARDRQARQSLLEREIAINEAKEKRAAQLALAQRMGGVVPDLGISIPEEASDIGLANRALGQKQTDAISEAEFAASNARQLMNERITAEEGAARRKREEESLAPFEQMVPDYGDTQAPLPPEERAHLAKRTRAEFLQRARDTALERGGEFAGLTVGKPPTAAKLPQFGSQRAKDIFAQGMLTHGDPTQAANDALQGQQTWDNEKLEVQRELLTLRERGAITSEAMKLLDVELQKVQNDGELRSFLGRVKDFVTGNKPVQEGKREAFGKFEERTGSGKAPPKDPLGIE